MPFIYKLYDELDCYVGSTTQTLKARLSVHICSNKKCKSVVILDRNKYKMELIEEVETKDRFEREQYWIDELSTLSQQNCYWKNIKKNKEETDKVYRENNRENIALISKRYYETNRVKLNETIYCECGGKYSIKTKPRHLRTKKHLAYIDEER
tara:strand:- start:160 stop:618 length:459 start_codon:yes stop_codon:yes gene_type:complete